MSTSSPAWRIDVTDRLPHVTWPPLALTAALLRVWGLAVFAVSSVALVLYPVDLNLEYSSIESLDAIPLLRLFALLLLLWMGLLFTLLWSTGNGWLTAGLVVCFGLVYFSFWTLRWSEGFQETWLKMQGVQVILASGRLAPALMHYGDWPGIAIFGATVSFLTGKEIADLVRPVVLIVQVTLPVCLYLFYWRLLGSTRGAAIATVLAIMANSYLARFHFHPFWIGPLLLIVALTILLRSVRQSQLLTSDTALMLILCAGLAIFHFYTGVLLFISLASVFVLHQWRWARVPSIGGGPFLVMAAAAFPAIWQLYWSSRISNDIARYLPELLAGVIRGEFGELFAYAGDVAAKNVGDIPLWANITRLGWLGGLYGIGALLAFWTICKRDDFPSQLRMASIWLLAASGTSALAILMIGGGQEFRRVLLYGSLFAAPVVVACTQHYLGRIAGLAGISMVLLVLAVPSFLVNGNVVSTHSYYPEHRSAGEFVSGVIDGEPRQGNALLYTIGAANVGWYYLPFALPIRAPLIDRGAPDLLEFFREGNERLMTMYVTGDATSRVNLMWKDLRDVAFYQEWFGPDGAAYALEPVYSALSETTAQIYDNGVVQLWTSS